MLNNVRLKRFLKSTIFKPISAINQILPKSEKRILLYSSIGGMIHNLEPIRNKLIDDGYNKKYKIYCGCENEDYFEEDEENVKYIGKIKSFWMFMFTKHVFYSTGQIPIKPSKNQIVILADHGVAAFKTSAALTNINNGDEFFFTHYIIPSEIYRENYVKSYLCDYDNIYVSGEPMTDFFYDDIETYNLNHNNQFSKMILWLPTFRESKYLNYDDSTENMLPMFDDGQYDELNSKLKKYNFKMIVKLHSMQDYKVENLKKYSNLEILSQKDMDDNKMNLYHLMKQSDVLLGDYSSVSMHYLLLDRPMGFVIPDYDEYSKKRGFVFDNPKDYMAGKLIYNKKDLYEFFADISEDKDLYAEKRRSVKDEIFVYQDGKDTERVLNLSGVEI